MTAPLPTLKSPDGLAGQSLGAAPLLGLWTLWSDKPPKEPGIYWLAGYFPADDDGDASIEPEEPIVWPVDDDHIIGKYSIQNIHGYAPENLVWCGPLIAPGFGPNVKVSEAADKT